MIEADPSSEGGSGARPQEDRCGLVLSGGGARGAYEVGVLRFLTEDLPRRIGRMPRFDIYSGTSVGAVHSCFLAAYADRLATGVERLVRVWEDMSFGTVYRFNLGDAIGFSRTLLRSIRGRSLQLERQPNRIHGLFNTEPLEQLVVDQIPWRRLRRNIEQGVFRSICISTTEIATGRTVVFVDNKEQRIESWTRDPSHVARAVRIGPEHALASAAIPVIFPAVRLQGTYFCDGGLRQQTPLAPALRLGCNRILTIGLRRAPDPVPEARLSRERLAKFQSLGFLFGKVLNAMLIDRLDSDLKHMRVINRVLRAVERECGADVLRKLDRSVIQERGVRFQIIDDVMIRPSEDLGAIAADHARRMRKSSTGSWVGRAAFRALTRGAPEDEADLMSYLLFDAEYASSLIELGRRDAAAAEEELARFFLR